MEIVKYSWGSIPDTNLDLHYLSENAKIPKISSLRFVLRLTAKTIKNKRKIFIKNFR